MSEALIRRTLGGVRWEGVPVLVYKEQGATFRSVTRQVLFEGNSALPVQLRYFEVGPGGHSTLERHDHVHLVWISRGAGRVFLGAGVYDVSQGDVVTIPSLTWHQFRAPDDGVLGFHCLVAVDRDKPRLPTELEWQELTSNPAAVGFLRK